MSYLEARVPWLFTILVVVLLLTVRSIYMMLHGCEIYILNSTQMWNKPTLYWSRTLAPQQKLDISF